MAIVREPCNIDAHANILALFMTMPCPAMCTVHTVYTDRGPGTVHV